MMRGWFALVAWVLTAVWLPAAQHCELEAIGGLGHEENAAEGCCRPSAGCEQDACDLLERTGPQLSVSLKAPVPIWTLLGALGLAPRLTRSETEPPLRWREGTDVAPAWVPIWHFVRRAAPVVRAPGVVGV